MLPDKIVWHVDLFDVMGFVIVVIVIAVAVFHALWVQTGGKK